MRAVLAALGLIELILRLATFLLAVVVLTATFIGLIAVLLVMEPDLDELGQILTPYLWTKL